jgi:peptidoglycan/LPS O-acetylase OafA/YrhL
MRRMIELDGLRGLACLSVLVAHYFGEVAHGWHFLALGWAGVDLFFCLS